jgi:uncharacterized RDD family membrane protein YckC
MLVCKPCKYYVKENAGHSAIRYCPEGHELEKSDTVPLPAIQPARRTMRLFGILIDFIIIAVIAFVILILPIPIFSQELGAIVICGFWLLRDINGRSLGKAALGTEVVGRTGTRSTSMQRIVRNIPFGIAILPLFIPFLGYLDFPVQSLMFLLECIVVLITGERLGDKLAGTMVIQQGSLRLAPRHLED